MFVCYVSWKTSTLIYGFVSIVLFCVFVDCGGFFCGLLSGLVCGVVVGAGSFGGRGWDGGMLVRA